MKYDFTGKERDDETSYDYFGARYYDSRIANWTSIDPLFEKHFDYSSYNYVLRNPMRLIDPDGKQIEYIFGKVASNMPLPAKEGAKDFVNSEPNYERPAPEPSPGLIEPTNIEFDLVAIGSMVKPTISIFKSILTESTERITLTTGFTMTENIAEKIAKRNISIPQVNDVLKKGEVFWDPKNKAFNYVLKNKVSDGKHLIVGVTEKGAIKTVYPTDHIPYKRMVKISQDMGISKGF